MGKYWKEPKYQAWYTFVVDGKRIGTLPDGAAYRNEKERLDHLRGIEVVYAEPEDLIKINAKTPLPKRIWDKMEMEARRFFS